ncbi:MAG: hypothetical protein V5789_03545 [Colwellia sp.]
MKYLFFSGIVAHIAFVLLLLWQPILLDKVTSKLTNKYYQYQKNKAYKQLTSGKNLTINQEIATVFYPWVAQKKNSESQNYIRVNSMPYNDLTSAVKSLTDGDTLHVPEGVYSTPMTITKNDITIKGDGHVVFEKSAVRGKGFILSQGNDLTVENIECRHISVRDGNGACIRLEGRNLTLKHVYFHHSQEGILETSKDVGSIYIFDSRFEQLGFNGQAHGLYTNKADLYIYQSLILASKSEGHSIKVRGKKLLIESSILASLSSIDSRLIDMSNGGELTVNNSILAQGPQSANGQMIGFGLEGLVYQNNTIQLLGNIIYLDRLGQNYLLAVPNHSQLSIDVTQEQNIIVGHDLSGDNENSNTYIELRSEMNLPNYPYFPRFFCHDLKNCTLRPN